MGFPLRKYHIQSSNSRLSKNNVKGFNPKYKIIFLESGVKFTGNALYFYQKFIFFPGWGMPPNAPSYGMFDVNPHLSLM